MEQFEARTSTRDGQAVVALAGECDLGVRDELMATLLSAVDGAAVVTVDLAELRFLDSSGVHALITGHHAAIRQGHALHVVNACGIVAQVLAMTGVDTLLSPPPAGC